MLDHEFGSLFLRRLIALCHGVPLQQALGPETAVFFAATVRGAVRLDRRCAWAAACFFLSGLAVAVWPAASLPGLGGAPAADERSARAESSVERSRSLLQAAVS